jgi:hypothetical protein
MIPELIIPLLPRLVPLLQEYGPSILEKGKRAFEVAIPFAKKASQLSITGVLTEVSRQPDITEKSIRLTQPLDIVDNGLSLPLSYRENQFKHISQKISDDLDIIKGQNEILFLSHSIQYFIDCHTTRTGIDRGVSYALQYDIVAACNHLNKRKDLRFPGYLLHQCSSLAETIKDLNIFYCSILQDGHVPSYTEEEAKEELEKSFGIDKRKGEMRTYVPYELKMRILPELPNEKGTWIPGFAERMLRRQEGEDANIFANVELYILKEELVANEELEYRIVKKLKLLREKKLIVQAADQPD